MDTGLDASVYTTTDLYCDEVGIAIPHCGRDSVFLSILLKPSFVVYSSVVPSTAVLEEWDFEILKILLFVVSGLVVSTFCECMCVCVCVCLVCVAVCLCVCGDSLHTHTRTHLMCTNSYTYFDIHTCTQPGC